MTIISLPSALDDCCEFIPTVDNAYCARPAMIIGTSCSQGTLTPNTNAPIACNVGTPINFTDCSAFPGSVSVGDHCAVPAATTARICQSGTPVPGAPDHIFCNVGTPQNGNCGKGQTLLPAGPATITSIGDCVLSVSSSSDCGCENSLQTTQSINLCDLVFGALENLNPGSLNIFGAPCDI